MQDGTTVRISTKIHAKLKFLSARNAIAMPNLINMLLKNPVDEAFDAAYAEDAKEKQAESSCTLVQ